MNHSTKGVNRIWNILASFTVMRRTFERSTKARLGFSGGPHAPINMANISECRWKETQRIARLLRYISCDKLSQILEVLRDFHRLFGSRSSPTTGILSAMFTGACGPATEYKPRFGAALDRSAHDCETRLLVSVLTQLTPVH